jgi:radical SAM superfamily enzyme YgiQ (UPF0313 family)
MKTPYCQSMIGTLGYGNLPLLAPPAESGKNVLQFELTEGCSHNACTFCDMYKDVLFREKTLDEFKSHVDQVLEKVSKRDILGRRIINLVDRVFLGMGDAFGVDNIKLFEAALYVIDRFHAKTRRTPRRVGIYGRVPDIKKMGFHALQELACGGTCMGTMLGDPCVKNRYKGSKGGAIQVIYVGIESGSDRILKLINKGFTAHDAYDALMNLKEVGPVKMKPSVTILTGVGGMEHSDEHIKETIQLLNWVPHIDWVTFMAINPSVGTPYHTWMQNEVEKGTNRPLTPREVGEQTAQIVERLRMNTTIGIFDSDVHTVIKGQEPVCENPVSVGSVKINGRTDARELAKIIREKNN